MELFIYNLLGLIITFLLITNAQCKSISGAKYHQQREHQHAKKDSCYYLCRQLNIHQVTNELHNQTNSESTQRNISMVCWTIDKNDTAFNLLIGPWLPLTPVRSDHSLSTSTNLFNGNFNIVDIICYLAIAILCPNLIFLNLRSRQHTRKLNGKLQRDRYCVDEQEPTTIFDHHGLATLPANSSEFVGMVTSTPAPSPTQITKLRSSG